MAAPTFQSLYEDISTRIEQFYNNGSILVDNKYIVGLYGENVKNAISKMEKESKRIPASNTPTINQKQIFRGRNDGIKIPLNTYERMFTRWKDTFVTKKKERDEVELRWAVNNVRIPMVTPIIINDFAMDTIKSLWYPIITGAKANGTITLTIVEERGMGMYQFFNALMNQFFVPQVLKPKSSFQKVSMYIIILNGEYITTKTSDKKSKTNIIDIPLQVFEFNSIVPKTISKLTFKQDEKADKVTFNISFDAPNIFQGTYKSTTMKGLMDNTTDTTHFNIASDESAHLSRIGDCDDAMFTVKKSELRTDLNGWYEPPAPAPTI